MDSVQRTIDNKLNKSGLMLLLFFVDQMILKTYYIAIDHSNKRLKFLSLNRLKSIPILEERIDNLYFFEKVEV